MGVWGTSKINDFDGGYRVAGGPQGFICYLRGLGIFNPVQRGLGRLREQLGGLAILCLSIPCPKQSSELVRGPIDGAAVAA